MPSKISNVLHNNLGKKTQLTCNNSIMTTRQKKKKRKKRNGHCLISLQTTICTLTIFCRYLGAFSNTSFFNEYITLLLPVAHLVSNIQITVCFTQCHYNRNIAIFAGDMKWRVTMAILEVYIAPLIDQGFNYFHLTSSYRKVQGYVTILKEVHRKTFMYYSLFFLYAYGH